MSTDVGSLIDALLPREGGYTNDPADRGGPTCWGCTQAVARAYGYQGPMAEMPRAEAEVIFLERYWLQPGFGKMDAIEPALAAKCFDVGVNLGQSTAVRFVQRALNVLNENGRDWADLRADGVLGTITLHALSAFVAMRAEQGRQVILAMVRAQQAVAYMEDAERDPTQERFSFGWAVRSLL